MKRKGSLNFPLFVSLSLLFHVLLFLSFYLLGARLGQRLLGEGKHVGVLFVDLGEIGGGEGGGEVPQVKEAPPPAPTPQKSSPKPKSLLPKEKPSPLTEARSIPSEPSSSPQSGSGGEAAGSGGGEQATPGIGGTGPGGPSGGGSKILAEIRRKIERAKRYPSLARQQEIEGSVRLSFSIEPSGAVSGLTLLGSSGSKVLDEEALATVLRAAPLPYYPAPIRISLKFSLEEN